MTFSTWSSRQILGIGIRELLLVVALYVLFANAYQFAYYLTNGREYFFFHIVALDYLLKALLTIPIWWLLFRWLRSWTLGRKVLLHFLLLPVFVLTWQQTFYRVCESLDIWHLSGNASWWDVYITSLFYVLQFGIFHVYDFYQRLQRQMQLEHELRQLALQGELAALKAQLNPHFLYNTFNAISASVPPGQENTRELIAKLSDLFRYQLQVTRRDQVSLAEELAFTEKYLSLEKARLGDRLKTHIEVSPDLEQLRIPPMLIQPLVENAIIHGIAPKIEGGAVSIKIHADKEEIHFNISDTGIGLQSKTTTSGTGIGLTNTRKRLKKLFNSQLQLRSTDEGGVSVQFSIPRTALPTL